MSDRGIHPDLLEEMQAAAAQEQSSPPAAPDPRGRGGRARSSPSQPAEGSPSPDFAGPAPAETESSPPPADAGGASETPETEEPAWFAQVRDAKDPRAALQLLAKNLPYDQLEQDEVLSGILGRIGDRRARAILAQQQQEQAETKKREAASAGDLYTLGELSRQEVLERAQREQSQAASAPFMDGVVAFQQTLPETIQRQVSGRAFGAGQGPAAGVQEYLQFITDEAVKLGVEQELRRRESALRKSVMTEVNGAEPVPERDGGTPGRVREVTDEQIANMTLAEYEGLFDENGHPRQGVLHRSTRGIPIRQH